MNICFWQVAFSAIFIYYEVMEFKEYFAGKKVTVMGLGLLGRGIGDAAYLAEAGAEVIVTDLKSSDDLSDSVDKLKEYDNIKFVLGEHRKEDFENRDFILVAAGVPFDSEFLQHAHAASVPQKQSAALFAELSKIPIVGITGTRGKSTVTHMIHHVLSEVTGEKVLLGGNVRGLSNLQLLNEVEENSLCVMELDSWQLQGWGWAHISPQIAVFTNFMEDHLDYYEKAGRSRSEAMDLYFADKANIFRNQEESGALVTTPEVFERAKKLKNITLGQEVVLADSSVIPEDALLAMPGEHNRLNAALATEALKLMSLTEEEIFTALASFSGVEGRLQYLGDISGAKVYNDNNATTPEATVCGLKAVGKLDENNVVLIIGGSDKNIEFGELPEAISQYCKKVILYTGTGTEKLKATLSAEVETEEFEMLSECVEAAAKAAASTDAILFSPAFSSFGKYFKNEYDRNDQFVLHVAEQIGKAAESEVE